MDIIELPKPEYDSKVSVEQALLQRRSIRKYKKDSLTLAEISQLLWAAQGITDSRGFRTAPSAGALYPLEVYVVAGNVRDLADGIYKYRHSGHELLKMSGSDKQAELYEAALKQSCIKNGAVVFVLSAVYERTTGKYGQRGIQYVHMEIGHAAQNIYLQAVSLNLGTVFVGAFYDSLVKKVLNVPDREVPLCIMPVGRK